ncbi:hypothetical protein, partial [Streptomyces sp. SID3343]|uniref:hypothetical protein n=1 Tax=Streptomyces sp. SID3343 TaxID=2690260 RepID=UPI00136DC839
YEMFKAREREIHANAERRRRFAEAIRIRRANAKAGRAERAEREVETAAAREARSMRWNMQLIAR